jgi:hypothetical protein
MRYLLVLLAASCASGWQQKTPAPEPEPDSQTEYTMELEGPAVAPSRRSCTPLPHVTKGGLTVAVANVSSYPADLCIWADLALGRMPSLTGIAGFELGVTLHYVRVKGAHVSCHVSVGVRSPTALVGVFQQAVSVQASSTKTSDIASTKRDCVEANLDDLVRQRAVPAIKRHAHASLPSASP